MSSDLYCKMLTCDISVCPVTYDLDVPVVSTTLRHPATPPRPADRYTDHSIVLVTRAVDTEITAACRASYGPFL